MKPKHHEILEEIKITSRTGNELTRYVLRYNYKLFTGGICQGIDTEVFYPPQETFTYAQEKMINKMCSECPVMEACLEWGLAHETYGIWGGTTPNRRKFMRKIIKWQMTEPKNVV